MRRQTTSFKELMLENKKQLLNDPEALAKIEERLDERSSKSTEQDKSYTK
ncbi:FbpB family small basic protein [Alkalihalobacillus deserti]|nr:FbpB family small basic protein [Alkalihalobacillus deserti]